MTPTVSKEHWHSKLIKCLNICDMVLRPLYGFVDNSIGKNLWPTAFPRFERRNVQEFQCQFITWSLISLWDFSPYPADPSLTVARLNPANCCFKLLTLKRKIGLIWCYSSHVKLDDHKKWTLCENVFLRALGVLKRRVLELDVVVVNWETGLSSKTSTCKFVPSFAASLLWSRRRRRFSHSRRHL